MLLGFAPVELVGLIVCVAKEQRQRVLPGRQVQEGLFFDGVEVKVLVVYGYPLSVCWYVRLVDEDVVVAVALLRLEPPADYQSLGAPDHLDGAENRSAVQGLDDEDLFVDVEADLCAAVVDVIRGIRARSASPAGRGHPNGQRREQRQYQ